MPDNLGTLIWTLCYTAVLLGISLYGLHRYLIVYLFLKNRRNAPQPLGRLDKLPRVTVQLPIFNELYVVERLLEQGIRNVLAAVRAEQAEDARRRRLEAREARRLAAARRSTMTPRG